MATQNAINIGVVPGGGFTYTFPSASGTLALTSGASGIVNSGTATDIAYYASTGTAVSGATLFTITNPGGGAGGNPVTLTVGDGTDNSGNKDGAVVFNTYNGGTLSPKTTLLGGGSLTTSPIVVTLPSATTTLVGRNTTDTLTNKTLTSPVLTTPTLGVATGTSLALGGATIGTDALAWTGTATGSGQMNAASFVPTSSTVPVNGMYLVAGTNIAFSESSSQVLQLSSSAATFSVPITLGTTGKITTGTIELGAATDTTISRVSAGVIAVEGITIADVSSAQTLTTKRITKRVTSTTSGGATPTIATDTNDMVVFSAQAAAITNMSTNTTGTPTNGQTLWISITDNATARAITWGTLYEASTVALPTTTVVSTRLDVGFVWNVASGKWRCVAVA